MVSREISFSVNGRPRSTTTDEERPLLDVLREDFQLTGTKYGCGQGECGACTVLVNGQPTRACITPVGEVAAKSLQTIEGLEADGRLHAVQQAFIDHQAFQCGFCVPGLILTAVALARDNPGAPSEKIVAAMSEHICRCCNYPSIRAAALQAVGRS